MRSFALLTLAFLLTLVLWSQVGLMAIGEVQVLQAAEADEKFGQPAERAKESTEAPATEAEADDDAKPQGDKPEAAEEKVAAIKPGRVPEYVTKGVAWLIAAQHNDGGWGGGSHAQQDVKDPHAVTTDPATTSFTLLALLRAGHTPVDGEYKSQVRKGLEYLVAAAEKAPADGPLITDVEGTQPQAKLGRYVDTAMTAQYLARALALLPKDDELHARVDKSLDKCLAKLQKSQQKDGSWSEGGGWAPVLQSSLSCSAPEIVAASGKQVDKSVLDRARTYQKGNFDVKSGRAEAGEAAGVELYAFNGAFRANASDAAQAESLITAAKDRGILAPDAPASEENLKIAGAAEPQEARKLAAASQQNAVQIDRLSDEQLLAGFGNNGGEEFLSYLMTSETLLIAGADKFNQWQDKIGGRLSKVQNADGSWSGHHCISSPVFCTAAVVQCLTTDQDAEFLVAMAKRSTEDAAKVATTTPTEAHQGKLTMGCKMERDPLVRRSFLRWLVTVACLLASASSICLATETAEDSAQASLDRAVAYLWSQQAEDGGWHSPQYGVLKSGQSLTPFVLYAQILALGSMSSDEAGSVLRAARFIEERINDEGAVGCFDPELTEYPVYSTAYGVQSFRRIQRYRHLLGPAGDASIKSMQSYLASAQFDEADGFLKDDPAYGGWGFQKAQRPGDPGHMDLAHTRRALEALGGLRSREKGTHSMKVKAQAFLRVVQKDPRAEAGPELQKDGPTTNLAPSLFDGGFYFSPVVLEANKGREDLGPPPHWRSYATATCDGLLALLSAGVPRDDQRVAAAVDWLKRHADLDYPQGVPTDHPEPWGEAIRFYHYSVRAEVYRKLDFPAEERAKLATAVAKHQRPDGSFVNTVSPLMKEDDPLLCTALAVVELANCLQ